MGFGGPATTQPVQPVPQPVQPVPQPAKTDLMGVDLMGFGQPTQPPQPVAQPVMQPPPAQNIGFDFGPGPSAPVGGLGSSQPVPAQVVIPQSGFVPISNTNPNKIMAY